MSPREKIRMIRKTGLVRFTPSPMSLIWDLRYRRIFPFVPTPMMGDVMPYPPELHIAKGDADHSGAATDADLLSSEGCRARHTRASLLCQGTMSSGVLLATTVFSSVGGLPPPQQEDRSGGP